MSVAKHLLVVLAATTLAACNGSGSSGSDITLDNSARTTVSGTAAEGKALAAKAVSAVCQDDSGFINSVTTGNDGNFEGELKEDALPCLISAATDRNSPDAFHSRTLDGSKTANVTPLTDMVLAIAEGQGAENVLDATKGQLEAALSTLKEALDGADYDTSSISGLTEVFGKTFKTDGSGVDGLLDDLMASFRNAGSANAATVSTREAGTTEVAGETKGYSATIADMKAGLPFALPKNINASNDDTDNGATPGEGDEDGDDRGDQACTATGLEGDNPLLAAASPLTDALCPETSANGFDPQACFMEIANPDTLMNLPDTLTGLADPSAAGDIPLLGDLLAGFGECDPSGDPMSCLTALTDTLQNIPNLLMSLPEQFAGSFPGLGADDDVCDPSDGSNGGFDPSDLFGQMADLGGLADAAKQVPVLGDIFGMIADNIPGAGGGDGAGLPFDPDQFGDLAEQLQNGNFDGLTEAGQEALEQIPVLGPVVGQLLGAIAGVATDCASNPGPDCLTGAADQFGDFADVLQQIPGLGDLIGAFADGGIPDFPGLPGDGGDNAGAGIPGIDQLQGILDNVPVLGPAINEGLGVLLGALPIPSDGDLPDSFDPTDIMNLFSDGAKQLEQIPGLGDFIGLLSGAASGDGAGIPGMDGDLPFPTNPEDALAALQQIPGLGDLIGAFSDMGGGDLPFPTDPGEVLEQLKKIPGLGLLVDNIPGVGDAGGDSGGSGGIGDQIRDGLDGTIGQIPVLGPILSGVLGGVLGGLADLIPS